MRISIRQRNFRKRSRGVVIFAACAALFVYTPPLWHSELGSWEDTPKPFHIAHSIEIATKDDIDIDDETELFSVYQAISMTPFR
jgi:hypothetical protein